MEATRRATERVSSNRRSARPTERGSLCRQTLRSAHPPLNPGRLPVGEFADYSDHPFDYVPPKNCPGPYAKIIFKIHFQVSAGVQYDRTGAVWIGATNVYFGTTAEPGSNTGPQWNVERDVTEYAPVFAQPSSVKPPSIMS